MKYLLVFLLSIFFSGFVRASNDTIPVYYTPVDMPAWLQNQYYGGFDPALLAEDLANLLHRSTGRPFKPVAGVPGRKNGIILELDSSLRDPNTEKGQVRSDGKSYVRINARYITGLSYAMYSWLKDLGFRFYLPGEKWTIIPSLASPFTKKILSKQYAPAFRMRMILASGGTYAIKGLDEEKRMEQDWRLWQKRNRMGCAYLVIDGHAGESFNIAHRDILEKDSTILAPVDGKRKYRVDAKLDPTNPRGLRLFSDWLTRRYLEEKKRRPWFLPLKTYTSGDAGDGLNYCHTEACEKTFRTVSDQSFYIINEAARALKAADPTGGVSTLAYTERSDTPGIRLEPNVHVMVVASAFQQVSTPADLMLRWSKKCKRVSQYDYLNIGVWNWDQPFFNLYDYHAYLRFLRKLNLEGMHYEASFSSLASGIQQYFILRYLCEPYQDPDAVLDEFCSNSFGPSAAPMKELIKEWYFSSKHLKTNYDHPVFYPDELGRFFSYLDNAQKNIGDQTIMSDRISDFRYYQAYLCQYYELFGDPEKLALYADDPSVKTRAVTEALQYTWRLYDTRIFHNTQLNDMLKNQLPESMKTDWDFRASGTFAGFRPNDRSYIDHVVAKYRQAYLPYATAARKISNRELAAAVPLSADSIRISTMDETAFTNFMYPLTLYAAGPGNLQIRFSTGEIQKPLPGQDKTGVISLEKTDYSLIRTEIIQAGKKSGTISFRIPSPGHYRLYLSQYQATHIDYVIYPAGQVFYHNKKSILMNGLRMQEPAEKGPYPNRFIAVWVPGMKKLDFNMMYAGSPNQASFTSADGKSMPVTRQPNSVTYSVNLSGLSEKRPYVIYENKVYRWPPVLLGGPDCYLYLRYPLP